MTPEQSESEESKRTTIRLPKSLYDDVSELAAKNHRSLNQEIIEVLYRYVLDERLGPPTQFLDANLKQLIGMQVGMLLSIDAGQINAPGLSEEQISSVMLGIAEYLRSRQTEISVSLDTD